MMDFVKRFSKSQKGGPGKKQGAPAAPKRKAMPAWPGSRLEHYQQWLGDGASVPVAAGENTDNPVEVLRFSPTSIRPFTTLISSGMSEMRMPGPSGQFFDLARAELLCYTTDEPELIAGGPTPWYLAVLRDLAQYPLTRKTMLGPGSTIPNGDPAQPYLAGSLLTTALLLPCFFESDGFTDRLIQNGDKVNFYWLTFITDSELAFFQSAGGEAFVNLMLQQGFPQVIDPFRQAII